MKRYLLRIVEDVDPELHGPYKTEWTRVQRFRLEKRDNGDRDGLFKLNVNPKTGTAEVSCFCGDECPDEEET